MNTVVSDKKKSSDMVVVSQETTKRLIKDVRNVIRHPLTDNGIYYVHDETNMLRGSALVIGPADTIYSYGYFLFSIVFPTDYPHSPPKLTYCTNDGAIRFHPNLYRNGKVCLSILNTWRGEQWSSCQSLRSVLLTLVTLFHNKPLLNEPGITESHKHFQSYNNIVEYKNWEVACFGMIKKNYFPEEFNCFYHIICKNFKENNEKIKESLEKLKTNKPSREYCDIYYKNHIFLDYNELYNNYKLACETINI